MAQTKVDIGPATLDITGVRAGDRNSVTVTLVDDYEPTDLTGATVTSQARPVPEEENTSITATVTVIDAKEGRVELKWSGEEVRDALNGARSLEWFWDLQVLFANETEPVTKIAGKIVFEMDVTR